MLDRAIAVINGKGGVGKTSIAANLAGLVAAAGYRVLVVDLDPQGNLSRDLGLKGTDRDDDGLAMFSAVTAGTALVPAAGVRPGLDVVCGGPSIDDMSGTLGNRERRGRDVAIAVRDALAPIASEYDLVLIDCPPGGQSLQTMALTAAHYAVIPTKPDAASLDGLVKVAELFRPIRERSNPELALLGVVLFDVEQSARRIAREAREIITRDLGSAELLFSTQIRHSISAGVASRQVGKLAHELEADLPEARKAHFAALRAGRHRADGDHVPTAAPPMVASASGLAGDYQALAGEVMARMVEREAAPA